MVQESGRPHTPFSYPGCREKPRKGYNQRDPSAVTISHPRPEKGKERRHHPLIPLALTVAVLPACGGAVYTQVGTVSSSQPAGNPSALGSLVFVDLPERVRYAFERAYQHAHAHPTYAAAVGHRAMLLHA